MREIHDIKKKIEDTVVSTVSDMLDELKTDIVKVFYRQMYNMLNDIKSDVKRDYSTILEESAQPFYDKIDEYKTRFEKIVRG